MTESSAHPNAQLIQRFYTAFAQRDGAAMAACYHRQASFEDPVFVLQGSDIGAMWTMLCERGEDLEVTFTGVVADDRDGRARWSARYTFTASGRKVENHITARFAFEDGLFVEHRDDFDFHRWARQALGPIGTLLGWSGWLRRKVKRQAGAQLRRWIDRRQDRDLPAD